MQKLLLTALLVVPALAQAQAPARGDAKRGELLFRMECASCHGIDGSGSDYWKKAIRGKGLASVPDIRDSAFLAQRSDEELRSAMRAGMGKNGWIPGHALSSLSTLDAWDIVQWLREGSMTVAQFYPEAAKFTAKDFRIDQYGEQRLADTLGMKLRQEELEVVVLTVYKGQRDRAQHAELVRWDPVELDLLKASDRVGFLAFPVIEVPGSKEFLRVGLAIGTDGKLQRVIVSHEDPKKKAEYQKILSAFVGQGQKGAFAFKAPRGVRNGAAWARALTRAGALTAEGITMYEKSERARTAFDR